MTTRTSDPVSTELSAAVHELEDGRLTRARVRLAALWERLGDDPSPHRCALAHWLAAAEGDAEQELTWHERAVSEADSAPDWSVPFAGTGRTIGSMYPQLHLDLARALKPHSVCGALEHLAIAANAVEALPKGEQRARLRREHSRLSASLNSQPAPVEDWGWTRTIWEDGDDFWSDDDGTG